MIRVFNSRNRRKDPNIERFKSFTDRGFTTRDLPDYIRKNIETSGQGAKSRNLRAASNYLQREGSNIIARKKSFYENLREDLEKERIADPLRTLTFTTKQNGRETTTRRPKEFKNVGQEITNALASKATNLIHRIGPRTTFNFRDPELENLVKTYQDYTFSDRKLIGDDNPPTTTRVAKRTRLT